MPSKFLLVLPLALLLGLGTGIAPSFAEDDIPDLGDQSFPFPERVNKAIDLGVRWLRAKPMIDLIPGTDKVTGAHWGLIVGTQIYGGGEGPTYKHPAGSTALALYTLMKCGVDPRDPAIERGFDWLRSFHQITPTWDGNDAEKVRYWTHTVACSSYELSVMILALTAKYDPNKKSAQTATSRRKGKLKIRKREDRLWLQQLVTALIERRGQPTKTPIQLDKSSIKRIADPMKEAGTPLPPEEELPPRADRLGWRYNTPNLNLVQVQKSGKNTRTDGFGRNVTIPPHANQDLSSTQLAALALFAAQQFGVKFDPQVWLDIMEFTLSHQEESGPEHKRHDPIMTSGGYAAPTDHARGFMYIKGSPDSTEGIATGSMTACGITNLLLAQEALQLTKKGTKLYDKHNVASLTGKAIWDGLAWLDLHWSAFTNPGSRYGYHIYYLYAIERAQDLRGKELIGKHLWYHEGAEELLKRIKRAKVTDPFDRRAPEADGGFWNTNATHDPKDVLDTCFALLFLKRATRNLSAPITPADAGPVDNR